MPNKPNKPKIQAKAAAGLREIIAAISVRADVFCRELQDTFEFQFAQSDVSIQPHLKVIHFLATAGDVPAGTCRLSIFKWLPVRTGHSQLQMVCRPTYARLDCIAVRPPFRKLGIVPLLLESVMTECRRHDIETLHGRSIEKLVPYYERMDWQKTGEYHMGGNTEYEHLVFRGANRSQALAEKLFANYNYWKDK